MSKPAQILEQAVTLMVIMYPYNTFMLAPRLEYPF